jgi:hypothetical protein
MSNKSILESAGGINPQTPPSQVEGVKEDQAEINPDPGALTGDVANISRRSGLSKREIMEDLSRQRFPWDE